MFLPLAFKLEYYSDGGRHYDEFSGKLGSPYLKESETCCSLF